LAWRDEGSTISACAAVLKRIVGKQAPGLQSGKTAAQSCKRRRL
jgi:hypothetical protein